MQQGQARFPPPISTIRCVEVGRRVVIEIRAYLRFRRIGRVQAFSTRNCASGISFATDLPVSRM